MKRKLWYLTRSYLPQQTGGVIMRAAQVERLNRYFDVQVITPNFESSIIQVSNNVHFIPFHHSRLALRMALTLEKHGIIEDYLQEWVWKSYHYLKNQIQKQDIIFSTTGGELACFKLGAMLKDLINCRLVMNYRDPVDNSTYAGMVFDPTHAIRDKAENKYLKNTDLIFTSSEYFAGVLKSKYPEYAERVHNCYFGFPQSLPNMPQGRDSGGELKIAYAGDFNSVQKPELLYQVLCLLEEKDQKSMTVLYVGHWRKYPPVRSIDHPKVILKDFMPLSEAQRYLLTNADMGMLSLSTDYLGLCVPSKLYEYINLGLPCLGLLPNGDAERIINENQIGRSFLYTQLEKCAGFLANIETEDIEMFKKNILTIRNQFSMDLLFEEMKNKLIDLS